MSEYPSEMSEISSVQEASTLVRIIGTIRDGSVKGAITHASRKLGWLYSRTKDIWYANAKIRIRSDEMDQLRDVANRVAKESAVNAVVALRRRLAATDAGMDREAAAALDHALRLLGEPVRTVDVPEGEGEG